MKVFITLFTLLLASLCAPVWGQSSGYDMKFNIKGLDDNTRIQLAYYYGEKKLLQDSAFVQNNNFTFSGEKALARGLYIVVIPEHGYFDLIVDNDQNFEIETNLEKLIEGMKVKGHEENTDFYKYLVASQPFNKGISEASKEWAEDSCIGSKTPECEALKTKVLDLKEEAKTLKMDYVKAHPNYLSSKMFLAMEEIDVPMFEEITNNDDRKSARFNHYKNHYFDNIDLNETGLIRTPIFESRIDKYFNELTIQQCDSVKKAADFLMSKISEYDIFRFMLNHVTSKYEKSKVMCMDCMNLHMFKNYYLKDSRVDWLDSTRRKKIEEETWKLQHNQCGNVVYPLSKKDTNGVVHDIMKVDAEYTIVYFWSATCGHCKKATPKMQEMYKRVKDEYDVEIYTVHIDKKRKEFDKFIQKYQFEWINTIDDGKDNTYRTAYNVFSTPTIYLLNSKKEIIAKKVDIATLEKIITGKNNVPMEAHDKKRH